MNVEVIKIIEYFVGSFACCLGLYFTEKILLEKRDKVNYVMKKMILDYIIIVILSILLIVNTLIFENGIAKIFVVLLVILLMYRLIFTEKLNISFVLTFFTYIIVLISELTFAIAVSIVEKIMQIGITEYIAKSYITNILISIFFVMYAYIFKKKIRNIMTYINKKATHFIICLAILTILALFALISNLIAINFQLNYKFVINAIVFIICVILLFVAIKQYLKNKDLIDKYRNVEDYMKTSAEVIEKYSSSLHSYKNKLIEVKGYMKTDIKKAEQSLDKMLDKYKTKKYTWFSKINYIKIDVIRYLVYYKLSKAEENNLKLIVDISKDIDNISETNLSFEDTSMMLEVLGEYFDNAIYAASESKEKELIFRIYVDDEIVTMEIANTYKGNVDLNSLVKNGYTTKGDGHGLGLYEAEKVIKGNQFIKHEFEIVDNYFIVKLCTDYNKRKFK